MRRLLGIAAIGLLLGGCAFLQSLTSGMNNVTQTINTAFTPSLSIKQLDQWGHWVVCDGRYYDVHRHTKASVRFYPGPQERIVSLVAAFDGNPVGCSGDYIIDLPDRRDSPHELRVTLTVKADGRDPVDQPYLIKINFLED